MNTVTKTMSLMALCCAVWGPVSAQQQSAPPAATPAAPAAAAVSAARGDTGSAGWTARGSTGCTTGGGAGRTAGKSGPPDRAIRGRRTAGRHVERAGNGPDTVRYAVCGPRAIHRRCAGRSCVGRPEISPQNGSA